MKKLKRVCLCALSGFLAALMFAGGVSAGEIVEGIQHEVVLASSFPLHLEIVLPDLEDPVAEESSPGSEVSPQTDVSAEETIPEDESMAGDLIQQTDLPASANHIAGEEISAGAVPAEIAVPEDEPVADEHECEQESHISETPNPSDETESAADALEESPIGEESAISTLDPEPAQDSMLDPHNLEVRFSLKNDFTSYHEYRVEVLDPSMQQHLLMEQKSSASSISLSGLEENESYPLIVRLYNDDHVRAYDARFVLADGVATVSTFTELETIARFDKTDKADTSATGPMSDEEYSELMAAMELPSFIPEADAREAGHIQRLQEYADSLDTIGFRNMDGSKTLYVFSSPVRYRDKTGQVRDGDPEIQAASSTMQEQGYRYYNDFGELEAYFPASMTDQKGVLLKTGSRALEFGFEMHEEQNFFQQAASAVSGLFAKENQATLQEETGLQRISYNKAVRHTGEAEVIPTLSGARQTLELTSMPEGGRVTFWVDTADLTARTDETGYAVEFVDPETDKAIFIVGGAELRDSYTGANEENNTHFSVQNTARVAEQNGTRTLVEITLDGDMLASPMTVYPLTVAVEAVLVPEEAAEVPAEEVAAVTDAAVMAASGPSEVGYSVFEDRTVYNNGTRGNAGDQYLIVGKNGTYTDPSTQQTCPREGMSFMKYDLSGINVQPPDIERVDLKLYEGSGYTDTVRVELRRVTTDWNENTVDSSYWSSIDHYFYGNNCLYVYGSGTKTVDITNMATKHLISQQGWVGGLSNYGFVLYSSATAPRKDFCSSEHSNVSLRPRLVIQYRDPATPSSIGLSTEKAYWIRPYNAGQYLCQNDPRCMAETMLQYNAGDPNGSGIDQLFNMKLYWKLEYHADTDDYWIIPFENPYTVLTVNWLYTNPANRSRVGIYDKTDVGSDARWRIEPSIGGGHRILSKAFCYTQNLEASLYSGVFLSDAYSDSFTWEFIEVECPTYWQEGGGNRAEGHPLWFYKSSTPGYFPHYECLSCHQTYRTPEEQDFTILQNHEEDLMAVFALQKAMVIKEFEGKDQLVEATKLTVDAIRSQYSGYDLCDRYGNYLSLDHYFYDASTIETDIDVSVVRYSATSLIGAALLWNANSLFPFPFNYISDELKNLLIGKTTFGLGEIVNAATRYVTAKIEDDIMFLISSVSYKLYAVLTALDYAKVVFNTLQEFSVFPGDYRVQIRYPGITANDFFDSYMFMTANGKITVYDMKSENESRCNPSVRTNRYTVSYSGVNHSSLSGLLYTS